MADLKNSSSTYAGSGPPDTATSIVAGTDEMKASQLNFPVGAIIGIQGILGNALTLKGTHTDLVARLAIALESDGKLKDVSATTKTVFPGVVSEGMLGVVSLTASEIIRMHASLDQVESTGLTVGGTPGVIVTRDATDTLTNKTITTPTITIPVIADFSSATHNHSDAANGGTTVRGGAGFDSTFTDVSVSDGALSNTDAAVTLTTTGGLVIFAASGFIRDMTLGVAADLKVVIARGATVVATNLLTFSNTNNTEQVFSIVGGDVPTAGAHTYTLAFLNSNGNVSSITADEMRIFAYSAQ